MAHFPGLAARHSAHTGIPQSVCHKFVSKNAAKQTRGDAKPFSPGRLFGKFVKGIETESFWAGHVADAAGSASLPEYS